MRKGFMTPAIAIAVVAFSCSGFAFDPSGFLKILGADVRGLKSVSGDFVQVRSLLGEAKQIDTGDAAKYEGRVEYILSDLSQSITFSIGECHEGYWIEMTGGKRKDNQGILNPSIKAITAGGLYLGMDKKEVDAFFAGSISGGWKAEKNPRNMAIPRLLSFDNTRHAYQKNVVSKDGSKFCNHIWITLAFDAHSKLTRIDIITDGCDDSACEDR